MIAEATRAMKLSPAMRQGQSNRRPRARAEARAQQHGRKLVVRRFLLAIALCSAACVASSGRLESNRFQHADYPYALFYSPYGKRETPLGPHYRLENYRSPDGSHLHPRSGTGFSITRSYPDTSPPLAQREPFYDLLLSRDQPKAAFWVRSVPLQVAQGALALDALADRYLLNVANSGRVAVTMGLEGDPHAARQYQVRTLHKRGCELSKREALRIDFEVEDAASPPGAPVWKRGSVVLVRSGYVARDKFPVLLLAGRSSAPEDAEALEPDFDRMLTQLVLGDKGQGLSMKGGHSCGLSGGPEPAPAAAPPADGAGGETPTTPELEVPIIQEDAAEGAPVESP